MPNPRRFIPDEFKRWTDPDERKIAVVEVTWRTICGLFLLVPTPRNTNLLLGVLGRAQDKYDFQIYAMAFLSNHGSMLIGVRSAAHLSKILRFVGSNIPRELGKYGTSRWKGRFWARRARAILVDSDKRLVERLTYIHENSVKENLVEYPTQWPGPHSASALCHGNKLTGTWYDRAKVWASGKRNRLKERAAMTLYEIKLSKLPHLAHMLDKPYQNLMKRICRELANKARTLREKTKKTVLGAKAARKVHPHTFKELEHSPAPAIHADGPEQKSFMDAYAAFLEAYQKANRTLLCATDVEQCFPEGGILPGALMT